MQLRVIHYVINLACTNVTAAGPSVAMDLPGLGKGLNANYISVHVQVLYMTHTITVHNHNTLIYLVPSTNYRQLIAAAKGSV